MFETINTGRAPDDGRGDTLRDAFEKTNRNFERARDAIEASGDAPANPLYAPAAHQHAEHVLRILADGAPSEPPPSFGAMWIDVSKGEIYLAVGVRSPDDWRRLALAGAQA